MATMEKRRLRKRRPAAPERTVVYRGIRIAPITGSRSPLAKAIRDGLRTKSKQSHGEPVQV